MSLCEEGRGMVLEKSDRTSMCHSWSFASSTALVVEEEEEEE